MNREDAKRKRQSLLRCKHAAQLIPDVGEMPRFALPLIRGGLGWGLLSMKNPSLRQSNNLSLRPL